ncbi:MAG: alpha/beta hydrolase family protein [Alphaproteobacteria bacterium]
MFEYFPDNYAWNLTVSTLFDEVGTTTEPEEALRALRPVAGGDRSSANEAWYQSLTRLAERLERLAEADTAEGHPLTAGRKYYRAALYYLRAERFMPHTDPREVLAYSRGIACYRKAFELQNSPVEFVDVPFGKASLPALFVPAATPGPAPCMIFLQGFDSLKEWYFPMTAMEFRRRGVAMLIVDQPGAGGALRLHRLPAVPETEGAVGACIDWLQGLRADVVDMNRVGVMGISLGGYYAPRAAAFEKRIAACIAWGAIWDFSVVLERSFAGLETSPSIPDMVRHGMWVCGKKTAAEFRDVARAMTLEGVAGRITCPLLVMHGENDRQVPLWTATKTVDAAVNARRRDLKIFTLDEGGAEHCQIDDRRRGADFAADWAAEILGGNPRGATA